MNGNWKKLNIRLTMRNLEITTEDIQDRERWITIISRKNVDCIFSCEKIL